MAATGNIGKTREHAVTIIGAVAGVDRVILGSEHQDPSDEFLAGLLEHPTVIVHPARFTRIASGYQNGGVLKDFEVDVSLLYAYAAHADFDNTAIEDLYEGITLALVKPVNWTGDKVSVCHEFDPFRFDSELRQDPIVSKWLSTCHFTGSR